MIRFLLRFFLLRFLPRRLLPILTAWEIFKLFRRRRDPELEAARSRDRWSDRARRSTDASGRRP